MNLQVVRVAHEVPQIPKKGRRKRKRKGQKNPKVHYPSNYLELAL